MSKKNKVAVVDIDGILWLMGPAWHCELLEVNPKCPEPGKGTWDFYKDYMTEEQMQRAALRVHMKQMIYPCFKESHKLTALLKKAKYEVIIASHRDPKSADATKIWLADNKIEYDKLYCGFDKHPLLDEANIFIDDSPGSQQISLDKKVNTFSIEYEYNKHMGKEGVHMFKDISTLVTGLEEWLKKNK